MHAVLLSPVCTLLDCILAINEATSIRGCRETSTLISTSCQPWSQAERPEPGTARGYLSSNPDPTLSSLSEFRIDGGVEQSPERRRGCLMCESCVFSTWWGEDPPEGRLCGGTSRLALRRAPDNDERALLVAAWASSSMLFKRNRCSWLEGPLTARLGSGVRVAAGSHDQA